MQTVREFGVPVTLVLREGGDAQGSAACEACLHHFYQENGIGVYHTAERVFRALWRVVVCDDWRATRFLLH